MYLVLSFVSNCISVYFQEGEPVGFYGKK